MEDSSRLMAENSEHFGHGNGAPVERGTASASLRFATVPRWLWLMALVIFPAVIGLHAWRTLDTLQAQRELYLRGRVSRLAARLESLPPAVHEAAGEQGSTLEALYYEEPALLDARVGHKGDGDDAVEAILSGREIFRMEALSLQGQPVLRAWVPFHQNGSLRVAILDFDASAADFFNAYAYQTIGLVSAIGLALIGLSVFAFRMASRRAVLERRHAELEHLARLGEMSAVLAHEIRNPLGSIKGFAQLMAEQTQGPARGYAAEIVGQSGRLERLVNDLLHYGRVPEPVFAVVEWNQIAASLRDLSFPLDSADAVRLEVRDAEIRFDTDALLLEQALANLVRNAREACAGQVPVSSKQVPGGRPGAVTVTASAGDQQVRITVRDNGPGLSTAAADRLFEPFFTTKSFGTGLGLAITRKLVQALRGDLELQSPPEGGLVATICLPLVSRGNRHD
jgi:two-component system, NtrC family, sensor histidine kinase HydH